MTFNKTGGAGGGGAGPGSVPGGNDGEVQFNEADAFAGDSGLTYDNTTQTLTTENSLVEGNLTVRGTTTSVNSDTLNIGDNHIVLNAGNTMFTSETGGLVVNVGIFSPIAQDFVSTGSFIAGIDTTSNPNVETDGTGIFAANDIVQVFGTTSNDGIYEVISHAGNVLTVRGVGTEATVETWTDNQFEAVTAEAATITKIDASVLLANADGLWGEATGSTTSSGAPFVFDLFNNGKLPFVVGKNTADHVYDFNNIQDAINAALTEGNPTVIYVIPDVYDETVTITQPDVSLYSPGGRHDLTTVNGLLTVNHSVSTHATIDGFYFSDGLLVTGVGSSSVVITNCLFDNLLFDTGDVISITNSNGGSIIDLDNCAVIDTTTSAISISRTAGNASLTANNCSFRGSIEFNVAASTGSLTLTSCAVLDGSIVLDDSVVSCLLNDTNISSVGTDAMFVLNSFSGSCTVIGGLMNVPSSGNVVTPLTSNNFRFSNVATSTDTLLTTEMGTRLDSDGVSLLSGAGQNSDTFLNATGDYSEIPGLQFVVGVNSGGSFKYTTIQAAINAAEVIGEPASIIVQPGVYTQNIEITKPFISLFAGPTKSDRPEIAGTVTFNTSVAGNISIGGFLISDQVIISGTANTSVFMSDCLIINAFDDSVDVISIINSFASPGTFEIYDCELFDIGVGNASISRTVGDMSLEATNCTFGTSIEFNVSSSLGDVTLNLCNIQSGSVDLSNSAVTASLNSTNITSKTIAPCLELTLFTGSLTVIGGLMDVGSGGNVVNPLTGVNFSFSNVATTAGTLLTTEMGTRLDSDGVSLLSGSSQDADNFLNATGDYSPLSATSTNQLILNQGNTTETGVIGGFIVNTDALGAIDTGLMFTAGIASTSNPSVTTGIAANFLLNDIVEISQSENNNGFYEVLSSGSNILEVRGVGNTGAVENWTKDQFVAETSTTAQIVKVNVSILFSNTDGNSQWGEASGSTTSTVEPFVFDIFNQGLQFVVGIGDNYQFNTIQSAINAAKDSLQPAVVIVTPGEYTEDVNISSADISIFSFVSKETSVNITGDFLINTVSVGGPISISGLSFVGNTIIAGLVNVEVRLSNCKFDNAGTGLNVIRLANTGTTSLIVFDNCVIREGDSSTLKSVLRDLGNMDLEATNSIFRGDIQFAVASSSGSFTLTSCALTNGSINISNGSVVGNIRDTSIVSRTTDPCLFLNSFTGTCTVTGGLMDVPSTGNVVTPLTSNFFSFSNVATTAGTLLTTEMGTRLDSDGVSLLSGAGQDSNSFLNATGVYSMPPALSSSTVQVFDEADIVDAFGAGPTWNLANVNLQVMENITLSTGNLFVVGANVTIKGVDRNIATITADTSATFITAATGGARLQINDMTFIQSGSGALLEQNAAFTVLLSSNCNWQGNGTAGSGDFNLLAGQLIHFSDGNMDGGASIVIGDGSTVDAGVDNIICDDTFLLTQGRNDQRCVEFTANSKIARFAGDTFTVLLGLSSETDGIGFYFSRDCSVDIFEHMNAGFRPLADSSAVLVMEDPIVAELVTLANNTFSSGGSTGKLYGFVDPLAADSIEPLTEVRGVAWDGANLIATSSQTNFISKYTGKTTPAVDITFPGVSVRDLAVWRNGDLIVMDSSGPSLFWLEKFSTTVNGSVDLSALPSAITGATAVTTDGSSIIICNTSGDFSVFDENFFIDGTSAVPYLTFTASNTNLIRGLGWDGVNLLAVDEGPSDIVRVFKGISGDQQYAFMAPGGLPVSVTITDTGHAIADFSGNNIEFFDVFLTVDNSSDSFEVMTNPGDSIRESSDRGGAVFNLGTVQETVVVSGTLWVDVEGTNIVWGDFTQREKCRVNNTVIGEILWTGSRDRARLITGSITGESSGPSGQFELAVVINDVVQYDSIGTEIFTSNADTKTVRTMEISRDLISTDLIKLQMRQSPVTPAPTSRDFDAFSARISLN